MNLANYHFETGEFLRTVGAMKKRQKLDVAELENTSKKLTIDDYLIPPYHTPSIPENELENDEYHCFLDSDGNVPRNYQDGSWTVKKRLVECVAYHKQTHEQKTFDDESLVDDDYTLLEPPSKYHTFDADYWVLTEAAAQQQLADVLTSSITRIDDIAISIYASVNKLMIEYVEAEKEAFAFKENNYEGEAGTYIMSDAIPNKITPKEACDKIIAQSNAWRALLPVVRTLRMRKSELKHCTSIDEINAITDDIVSNLNAIKEQL